MATKKDNTIDSQTLVAQGNVGKPTLYTLSLQGRELETLLDNAINWETGEFNEEYEGLVDLKNVIQEQITNKSRDIIYVLRKKDGFVNEIDKEIARLKAMKSVYTKQQEGLSKYIKNCMEIMGVTLIETPIGKFSIKNNPESVEIFDETLVPKEYWITKIKEETNISKTKIKEAIKNGEEVQGAKLVRNTRLEVK